MTRHNDDTSGLGGQPSKALSGLMNTVIDLQSKKWDSIRILTKSQVPKGSNVRHVNSIVFTVEAYNSTKKEFQASGYVLAILDQNDRVNVTRLEQAVVEASHLVDGDERRTILTLAPTEQLPQICGFGSGTVPPLGLTPSPIVAIIESALVPRDIEDTEKDNTLLVGGGGLPDQSVLFPIGTLLESVDNCKVFNFRDGPPDVVRGTQMIEQGSLSGILSGHESENYQKPFFSIAPPDMQVALQIINGDSGVSLSPEWVVLTGRISGLRQMARRLVFVDLAPSVTKKISEYDVHPWRNPRTGQDMAVQLIVGKTFCQRPGVDEAELALKRLKVGQLIMVQGKTNVGTRSSLQNWCSKTSLDITVFDCQQLQVEADSGVWDAPVVYRPKQSNGQLNVDNRSINTASAEIDLPFLQLQDIYPDRILDTAVVTVDDLARVREFHTDMLKWLADNPDETGLVGIDCEWKPSFLASSHPQPVLLLQICLHPVQKVYLFDLQSLLRPLCPASESHTAVEAAVFEAIGLLYHTDRLIKVGFQVANDFQRLAASYPHLTCFREVNSVLEVSKLGMKVMQMLKQSRGRLATSSLIKMTERFVQRSLNKKEQISDWSIRPLSEEQLEYSALDAAVTPFIGEALLVEIGAQLCSSPLCLRRWEGDIAFVEYLVSWRFLLLHETETTAIRRWNAKRLVGDSFLVSQTWTTGQNTPILPTFPHGDDDAPFVDLSGIKRIPSHTVSVIEDDDVLKAKIGDWTAKSKARCIMEFLGGNDCLGVDNDECTLDFPQRSGVVELANAAVLFVTLPTKDGRGQSRSYPNEWLEEGSILSWFIKDHDWKEGSTRLAKKMLNGGDGASSVLLFVRRGKGLFFSCGRCRVVTLDDKKDRGRCSDQWSIIKLYLMLMDFGQLQANEDFQEIVNPARRSKAPQDFSVD